MVRCAVSFNVNANDTIILYIWFLTHVPPYAVLLRNLKCVFQEGKCPSQQLSVSSICTIKFASMYLIRETYLDPDQAMNCQSPGPKLSPAGCITRYHTFERRECYDTCADKCQYFSALSQSCPKEDFCTQLPPSMSLGVLRSKYRC